MCRIFLTIFFGCVFAVLSVAQSSTQDRSVDYGPIPEDLANVLAQMARTSHTPLIAELTQPLPAIKVSPGTPLSPASLNALLKSAPGYSWTLEGNVIHFYNQKIRHASFNFLNLRFPTYKEPPNLSDFKLWFPGNAIGLLDGFTGQGGATSGFGDIAFEKQSLRGERFTDISGIDVLMKIANEKPMFYCVLVFTTDAPSKQEAKLTAWFWGSLDEKMVPLYVQPAKKRTTRD